MTKHFDQTNEFSHGTMMMLWVDELEAEECRERFDRNHNAYFEPENGYDGDEWVFINEEGKFATIYFRYGSPRIGAESIEVANEFADFLRMKTGKNFGTASVDPERYKAVIMAHKQVDSWSEQ